MESIEKLRYYFEHGIIYRDELIRLTDAIEREIAEKYMELDSGTLTVDQVRMSIESRFGSDI